MIVIFLLKVHIHMSNTSILIFQYQLPQSQLLPDLSQHPVPPEPLQDSQHPLPPQLLQDSQHPLPPQLLQDSQLLPDVEPLFTEFAVPTGMPQKSAKKHKEGQQALAQSTPVKPGKGTVILSFFQLYFFLVVWWGGSNGFIPHYIAC